MSVYRPTDQQACDNILKTFREAEVDGNNKLSLGGEIYWYIIALKN
jgi:hypothetical protein